VRVVVTDVIGTATTTIVTLTLRSNAQPLTGQRDGPAGAVGRPAVTLVVPVVSRQDVAIVPIQVTLQLPVPVRHSRLKNALSSSVSPTAGLRGPLGQPVPRAAEAE